MHEGCCEACQSKKDTCLLWVCEESSKVVGVTWGCLCNRWYNGAHDVQMREWCHDEGLQDDD